MSNPSSPPAGRIALKTATEYPLPANQQTHEIVSPAEGLLLVSQQPGSALVKIQVDRETGRPIAAVSHVVGDSFAGLHGLCVSRRHPGRVWATLQFTSELLLIDPVADDLEAAPKILQRVTLPPPARGPHGVIEDGDDLWTSCKDSHHVVRVRPDDPKDTPSIYPCPPRPIFVAVHPRSGDVYASLDQESAIFRISRTPATDPTKGTEVMRIPADRGATPVGLIAGPDGNIWFVLLGGGGGGTGTFGRICEGGTIEYFRLKSGAAMGAALIHLAFSPDANQDGAPERIFVLGSSMASMMALNAVFEVGLSGGYARIESQQTIAFPSQNSMSHRVLPTGHGIYATELGAGAIVHLAPARRAGGEEIDERSDAYSLWGCGVRTSRVEY
jgi:streptogramin lyase